MGIKLKDSKSIFGIDTDTIRSGSKTYTIGVSVSVIIDIVLMCVGMVIVGMNAQVSTYFLLCVILAILTNLSISFFTKSDYRQVFSFYKKNKNRLCEEKNYDVTNENLFAVLFCTGYTKVKPNQSRDTYIECMRSACCLNAKYSKRIMRYLSKYEVENGGTLKCLVLPDRKQKLVEIIEED